MYDDERKSERKCINCGRLFMSKGPHHRICRFCKAKQAQARKKTGEILTLDPIRRRFSNGSDAARHTEFMDDVARTVEDNE